MFKPYIDFPEHGYFSILHLSVQRGLWTLEKVVLNNGHQREYAGHRDAEVDPPLDETIPKTEDL